MIKILFFIEDLEAGGAEKVLRDLVNHMDQTRFDITVQTVWPGDAEKLLVPGIRYLTIYHKDNCFNRQRYRLEAELGLTYPLHIRDDYDIECAYMEMGTTKIMAASTNKMAKKLAWVHCDLKKKTGDWRAFSKKTSKWYRRFDEVVCVSESVRKNFREIFGDDIKTQVLYNVVDDALIRRRAEEALPSGLQKRKLTVVSLGRLTCEKAYGRLLSVHRRLIEAGLDYDLWIAGEGEDRPKLEQYIRDHHLEDSVRLTGFLDNPYPLLKTADLLVCSSKYEGFSTFVSEGLILGKAFVTTDCSGMRELLGDSEYGLVVDNEEQALLQGMHDLLSDDSLRDHYSEQAKKRGTDFSAAELCAAAENYFMKLAGETN